MPKGKKKTVDDSIHPADSNEAEGDLIDAEMDAPKKGKKGKKKNADFDEAPVEDKGGKQGKKKGKGDGGKQRMKEMAETRREGLVEFGDSLIEDLEEKLIKYFDDDKKEIFLETVQEALEFYEENWSQSYSEDVFEGKKNEIRTAWDEIVKLCRAEWTEENKDSLNAQKEEQKLKERMKNMEKLGIKAKSQNTKGAEGRRGGGGGGGFSAKAKISKKQLKELQRQLEDANKNKNKKKDENEKEDEDNEENEDENEEQDENEINKNQGQAEKTELQKTTTAPEAEKEQKESETKPTKPADDEEWSASDSDEEEGEQEESAAKNKKKKPVSKQFKDDLSDTETKPKQNKKRRKHKKPVKPKEQESSAPKTATEKQEEKEEKVETKQGKPEAKKKDKKGKKKDDDKDSQLKSPIVVVMGHVDTGKTKILDRIRHTSVQAREAGGITQQIGATYLTKEYIAKATARMKEQTSKSFETKLPGLLFIDTPGHESFANLRARGSSMCDIAVLVVDLMHGLEKQTLESLKMLKDRHTPFIVALNKIDRCLDWIADEGAPFQLTYQRQKNHTKQDFENRLTGIKTEFAENGWNTELYFRNKNITTDISLVPTSAITGEGIPDLLDLLIQLSEKYMKRQLRFKEKFVCTVLEVKNTVGHGTTLDVILSNGTLRKDDTIIVCGMPPQGTIITNIRALLLPSEASEMRERAEYRLAEEVHASAGVRISATGLEHAVPGAHMEIVPRHLKNSKDHAKRREEIERLTDEVQQDYTNVFKNISRQQRGVYVQASTLGALEALITFLQDLKPPIPICGINIGDVHKQDVIKAGVMLDHQPEFAVILAFNVKVDPEARELAKQNGVQIFTAEIIYHLEDAFNKYMQEIYDRRKAGAKDLAVFPVELEILPEHIIHNKYPIVVGVKIVRGTLRKQTPICAKRYDSSGVAAPLYLGKVVGIQVEKKDVDTAKAGEKVAVKIEGDETVKNIQIGRQFDEKDRLISLISRDSLDALKNNFKDDIDPDDVKHLHELKVYFSVI